MPAAADPDLAARLAKEIADLYGEAVDRMLATVARRLASGIDTPGWAERKLAEVAQLRNEAQAIVDRLAVLGPVAMQDAITEAAALGADIAAADLGVTPRFGRTNTLAVDALTREAVTLLEDTHGQILRSTVDAYRTVIAESGGGVLAGTETRRQATQRALDRFADRGITGLVDRSGRRWSIDTYSEMATRTAVGRAQVAGTLDRYQQAGRDLVIVSDSPGECSRCRPWEGMVLSISGAPGHPSVSAAQAGGLQHANCRHSMSAYIEGLTRPMTNTADPEGDRNRQEQRRLERGVRQWKRRELVALDDQAKTTAARHRKAWQDRLGQHVRTNDLKRLPYREAIGAAR